MPKRKRASTDDGEDNSSRPPTSESQTSNPSNTMQKGEQKFSIVLHPYSRALNEAAARTPARGNRTAILKQNAVVKNGPRCGYQVAPADDWNSIKKYNKFVVQDTEFVPGQYVYIYHFPDKQQAGAIDPAIADYWIAQVLEIRASSQQHVYLRVFWLYWPEDLPGGRQWYHGRHELIQSNDMQILDAMTVTAGAVVNYWDEKGPAPVNEMYWRQSLDYSKKSLSTLQKYCYCNGYDDTEGMFIQCAHCKTELHTECLLRDARSRAWKQSEEKIAAGALDRQCERDMSDSPKVIRSTIPDSQQTNGSTSETSWLQLPPPPPPPVYSKPVASKKKRKAAALVPWEDHTEAELQFKPRSVNPKEATGWAIVRLVPVDKPSETMSIGLRCLMPKCGRWLYDASAEKPTDIKENASQGADAIVEPVEPQIETTSSKQPNESDRMEVRDDLVKRVNDIEEKDDKLSDSADGAPHHEIPEAQTSPEESEQGLLVTPISKSRTGLPDDVDPFSGSDALVEASDSVLAKVEAQSESSQTTTNGITTPHKTPAEIELPLAVSKATIHGHTTPHKNPTKQEPSNHQPANADRTIDDSTEEITSSGIDFLSQEVQKTTTASSFVVSGFNRVLKRVFPSESPKAASLTSAEKET